MAGAITYPTATPDLNDLLLGTQIKEDGNLTKNFTAGALRSLFAQNTNLHLTEALYAPSTNTTKLATVNGSNKVTFGDPQTTDYGSLSSQGAFTFSEDGMYQIIVEATFAAYDAEAFPCIVMFKATLNNVNIAYPEIVTLENANQTVTKKINFMLPITSGDTFQCVIGSSANSEPGGGLYMFNDPTAAFPAAPPAILSIQKVTLQ